LVETQKAFQKSKQILMKSIRDGFFIRIEPLLPDRTSSTALILILFARCAGAPHPPAHVTAAKRQRQEECQYEENNQRLAPADCHDTAFQRVGLF
jgi:hypothetical protein